MRRKQKRARSSIADLLLYGVTAGVVIGIGSLALTSDGRHTIAAITKRVGVATGLKREREPQPGDYWYGCDSARASGTAPIYRGEPGYRPEMDGDDDGIACEPYS